MTSRVVHYPYPLKPDDTEVVPPIQRGHSFTETALADRQLQQGQRSGSGSVSGLDGTRRVCGDD